MLTLAQFMMHFFLHSMVWVKKLTTFCSYFVCVHCFLICFYDTVKIILMLTITSSLNIFWTQLHLLNFVWVLWFVSWGLINCLKELSFKSLLIRDAMVLSFFIVSGIMPDEIINKQKQWQYNKHFSQWMHLTICVFHYIFAVICIWVQSFTHIFCC